jgi:hypothetical protein
MRPPRTLAGLLGTVYSDWKEGSSLQRAGWEGEAELLLAVAEDFSHDAAENAAFMGRFLVNPAGVGHALNYDPVLLEMAFFGKKQVVGVKDLGKPDLFRRGIDLRADDSCDKALVLIDRTGFVLAPGDRFRCCQ